MRMVLRIFFAGVTGKMWMPTQYYKLKKHISLKSLVGITLRAIYVRHKTSHRHKSRVNGGETSPQNLYWVDDTYNVINNAVCRLFTLICTGYNVLHCIWHWLCMIDRVTQNDFLSIKIHKHRFVWLNAYLSLRNSQPHWHHSHTHYLAV